MLGKTKTETPIELSYATNYSKCFKGALIRVDFKVSQKIC